MNLTQEEKGTTLERALHKIYEQTLTGMPLLKIESVDEIADDYTKRHKTPEVAIDAFITSQIAKCTATGFMAGLGGILTFPVTLPADLASALYIQLRMIAVIARIRGYDVKCDEVRTFAYLALCGSAASNVVKEFGIKFGVKYFGRAIMKSVTRSVLVKINKAVGFRLITKGGTKGLINLGKATPVIGGLIGGGFNLIETKIIAKTAKEVFINA